MDQQKGGGLAHNSLPTVEEDVVLGGEEETKPAASMMPSCSSVTEESTASLSTTNTTQSAEEQEQQSQELWILQEERWELTWPIWHMLPRSERKAIADKYGYKTIGEFEEYMTLQRAVGDSSTITSPYKNESIYVTSTANEVTASKDSMKHTVDSNLEDESLNKKPKARCGGGSEKDGDDDEDSATNEKLKDDEMESERIAATDRLPQEELIEVGGCMLILPEEILHRVFSWLPVDAYAILALVSPHWKSFTRTETVYKRLCERLYLNQSKRRALHVSHFGNSYRTMLEKRPRVRAGGGVYVLKYVKIKHIQRDMWTEIPKGAILESVYYRYLYFQEDGRVLYALTASPPQEMFRRFLRVCITKEHDQAAVWGTYQVQKRNVTVVAKQEWQYVKLDLTIQPSNLHGRYGLLSFDSHVTNTTGIFEDDYYCPSQVVYEVPEEPFRFVKDKRL